MPAKAWIDRYDFREGRLPTEGKAGDIAPEPFQRTDTIPPKGDHRPGEYAELVTKAKESFRTRRSVRGGARPEVHGALRQQALGDFQAG